MVAGAGAVGAGQRLTQDVLQAVDVHARATRPDGAFGRRHLRVFVCDQRGDDLAVEKSSLVRRPWRKGNVHMETVGAGCFRRTDRAEGLELVADPAGHVEHAREGHAVGRVEVESGAVREFRVGDA